MPARIAIPALFSVAVAFLLGWLVPPDSRAQTPSPAIVLELDGPIGPGIADYLVRGIEAAAARGAPLT
ncbi:MAG: hypothetical protein ACRED5_21720, partial [Propylenella sp.]